MDRVRSPHLTTPARPHHFSVAAVPCGICLEWARVAAVKTGLAGGMRHGGDVSTVQPPDGLCCG
jgi:hypothetical protein